MTVQERIESKIEKNPSGCWLWMGCVNGSGYGSISVSSEKTGQFVHRVVWELVNGPIPKGMHVCHTCDVRACANPDHLFLGSRSTNMKDSVKKKRHIYSKRTKCKNGHLLDGNSYTRSDCVVEGRRCKTCASLSGARCRARRKAK